MPTVLIVNGFRFFFYCNEHVPIYIHIEKTGRTAKFTIETIELVKSFGFNANDLKQIRNLVEENRELFIQKWDGFFNN